MRTRLAIAALAFPVLILTACGEEADDSATDPEPTSETTAASGSPAPSESQAPTAPACADVWVDGGTLPQGYQSCAEGDVTVPADALGCSSGQEIVRYADRFFAVPGGMIRETSGLRRDQDYLDAITTCRG